MAKQIIHISDVEAAKDFSLLLTQVNEGAEIVIEHEARPIAVLCGVTKALAEAHAKEQGEEPTIDPDFVADLKEIINSRKPRNLSTWD
jgi:antitoxin (DNA-binding transcriptional repressor) of toxin-antitoxin stability system